MHVQCSVDICIIWLCIVFICVSHIIAFCFFCYVSLSIYNPAPLYSLPCLYFYSSSLNDILNAFVYILKLRSTSLILPTLILFLIQLFLDISILAITILFSNKGRDIVFVNIMINELYHLASHLHFTVPMTTAFHPHIHSGPNPGQPFPQSTNIPFSGPDHSPYGHLISCHPFPLTKCWVCKLCNKWFLWKIKALANQTRTKQVANSHLSLYNVVHLHIHKTLQYHTSMESTPKSGLKYSLMSFESESLNIIYTLFWVYKFPLSSKIDEISDYTTPQKDELIGWIPI